MAVVAILCASASAAALAVDAPWSGHHSADPASHTATGRPQTNFFAESGESGLFGDSATPVAAGGGSADARGQAGSSASPSGRLTSPAPTPSGSTADSAVKAPALTSGSAASSTASSAPAGAAAAAPAPLTAATPHTAIQLTSNIAAVPASDSSCSSAPTGAACTNAAIAALNHARSVLGLPAYAIPAGFATMDVAHQLLTLSNLDRALYGLSAIGGINTTLNTAAQQGVTAGGDPTGVNVGTVQWQSWASNWAMGYPNAIFTYYAWMYDDGLGSPNADCTSSNSSGCWGHRLNTLHNFGTGVQIAMGVGFGSSAYTELYESFASTATIPFS